MHFTSSLEYAFSFRGGQGYEPPAPFCPERNGYCDRVGYLTHFRQLAWWFRRENPAGMAKIEVDFNQPVTLVPGAAVRLRNSVTSEWYVASSSQIINGGFTLAATFAEGVVPDGACCVMDLAGAIKDACGDPLVGDTNCMIRVLAGDVDGSGAVDQLDMSGAASMNNKPLLGPNIRFDVNLDGRIDLTDVAMVKVHRGGTVTCP